MASVERPWVLIRIRQPGQAKLRGRYTLVVSEHPGSGSDPPIGSDRKGVLHVEHTQIVKQVKSQFKKLPYLGILQPYAFPIIETDTSNIGYGGILNQDLENKISIVKFHSGIWSGPQEKYSTVKKEILVIVLCIQKF